MHEIRKYQPDNFELQTHSVWELPKFIAWATHNSQYRGAWSPYVPRNIILRYSKAGDTVLDPFVGGGSTMVEAKLLNRNGIGLDINESAVNEALEKVDFEFDSDSKIEIEQGDALKLEYIRDKTIDLICTQPPYANTIVYNETNYDDISQHCWYRFINKIFTVATECYRVLKEEKICAVQMGDVREYGLMRPLSLDTMRAFQCAGFRLKDTIIIKSNKNYDYLKENSVNNNYFIRAHEYLFIFEKPAPKRDYGW